MFVWYTQLILEVMVPLSWISIRLIFGTASHSAVASARKIVKYL